MNAADVITAERCGVTLRDNRRGIAHIDYTLERLAMDAPQCHLRIIQTPYNQGVKASAGTHDYGAVYDVQIVGMDWLKAQGFLRRCGWAAWYRTPAQGFTPHIHMVSLGYPGQVGVYVPGQVRDYYARRTGLAGHAADASWFPADIDSTVFDFDQWKEAHMPLNPADIELVKAAVREVLNEASIDVGDGKKWSAITVWRSTLNKVRSLK